MAVSANRIRDEAISNDRKKRGLLRLFLFLILYEVFFYYRYSITELSTNVKKWLASFENDLMEIIPQFFLRPPGEPQN
jgi:hypothetical protein